MNIFNQKFVNLKIEKNEGIPFIIINRAEKLNALNQNVLSELKEVWTILSLTEWKDCPAVVLTGEGEKSFVAGADIAEMQNMDSQTALNFSLLGHQVFHMMERFPRPIIAAVYGHALGGGLELALACDFIMATPKGQWGLPEAKLGVIPGFGGWSRLKETLGLHRAKSLVLTAKTYTSEEMYQFGLIYQICPDLNSLKAQAIMECKTLSMNGPRAMKMIKKLAETPETHLLQEAKDFASLFQTHDQKEGMHSFVERRPPNFKNK